MKIKGIHKKLNRETGAKPGDPIEYSPEEKVPLAVKDAVTINQPEGHTCWAPTSGIHINKFNFSPLNEKALTDKRFSSNIYSASGKVSVRTLVNSTDVYQPAKEHNFNIKFKDTLDYLGQPDLVVTEFNLK